MTIDSTTDLAFRQARQEVQRCRGAGRYDLADDLEAVLDAIEAGEVRAASQMPLGKDRSPTR